MHWLNIEIWLGEILETCQWSLDVKLGMFSFVKSSEMLFEWSWCVMSHSADLPGTARWCPSVTTAVYISRRHPDPTKTSVFHLGRSVRSCCQTAYCWTLCFLCRWHSCLEYSSCHCHFSTFRKRLKLHLFPLSCPCLVLWINFFSLRGPCGSCLLLRPP